MENLIERVSWAIGAIKGDAALDKGINDPGLARKLNVNKNTLVQYRAGKGLIKGDFLQALVDRYQFNPVWLFQGEGEPFPGAREHYPEVCGEVPLPPHATDPPPTTEQKEQRRAPPGVQPFEITQAVEMLMRILGSGNQTLIRAIVSNLEAFSEAVEQKDRLRTLEEHTSEQLALLNEMGNKLAELEQKMTNFQQENEELRRELTQLKADRSKGDHADGATDTSRQTG